MIRLLLFAAALLAAAAPLEGQALHVRGADTSFRAGAALHRGYPAHAADALEALNGEILEAKQTVRIALFGDTLEFAGTSPFFVAGGRVYQLASPVYREGGVLYLPRQFFVEWLPAHYPERLALRGDTLALADVVADGPPAAATAKPEPQPEPRPEPESVGAAERVVIIDAGHGGRDPGKIGPSGLREKDVTLAVSRRLARVLKERGYEVHLTRTTDTLIALADRPHMANEWKAGRPAALFLSIHANSFRSPGVRGFETFFLSEARTEDERRVAEMENAAVQYEEEASRNQAEDDLGYILNNLRNTYYLRASNDLAEVIQDRLAGMHPGPNRGVKQAGFRVLVGAFMPAVLVELAFISNPREEKLLGSAAFQDKLTGALADAVDRFFDTHQYLSTGGTAGTGR